jgi:hypothetical protein
MPESAWEETFTCCACGRQLPVEHANECPTCGDRYCGTLGEVDGGVDCPSMCRCEFATMMFRIYAAESTPATRERGEA